MSLELTIVFLLILLNAFFALSEMAVMTARKTRLRQRAGDSRGARIALELAERPERFLSSVQVWITLIGILTGFFGGETIAVALRDELALLPWIAHYAEPVSVGVSVGIILFVSVVVGELVPKRLAIVRPEKIATAVAIPMRVLATAAAPAVSLLSVTTEALFKLFPVKHGNDSDVTEEEIKMLVAESHEQGVIDIDERNMVNRVLNLGDRTVDSLMTPRTRIAWLDAAASLDDNLAVLRESRHSRYPVYRTSDQDVLGVVETKMMVAELASGHTPELFRELQPPLFVPEAAKAMQLLDQMRESEAALAFVVDEYGDIQGMVTMGDLMGAVFGRLAHAIEANEQPIVQRGDGSWLIDGSLPVQDLRELLGLDELPHEVDQEYRTLAGMFMAQFGRIPAVGEHFDFGGFRFEVIDLDGARIDKALVSALPPTETG
ncbi:MAG TPA: hemolysin family protein [Patescibacteria group bacterium]|nr:hemolysin family protein [Patescibacteria group bacterium]